jgi:hypothetical protein
VTAVAADASFDHRGLGHCYIILRTTRGSDLEEWRKRGDGGVCCVALWSGPSGRYNNPTLIILLRQPQKK